jgi:hypothetical protein
MNAKSQPTHLFIIDAEIWKAASLEEVQATCAGLRQMDLYHLPYAKVTVQVPADEIIRWVNPETGKPGNYTVTSKSGRLSTPLVEGRSNLGPTCYVQLANITTNPDDPWTLTLHDSRSGFTSDMKKDSLTAAEDSRQAVVDLLICMLATRNAVKTTKHSKLAKLGIGGKRRERFDYTTTISMPAAADVVTDEEHPPTGRVVCPHLRRGHVRNQPYGPRRTLRRPQWIDPMFIHADEEFVKRRTAYNISGKAP